MEMIITEKNYVEKAENVILKLKEKKDKKNRVIPMVTTSKLRNLLSMTSDIYNEILNFQEEELSEEICGRIDYLKVRFLYEAGREEKVRDLVEEAKIIDCINEKKGSRKRYILFSRYMEALVAYHRYYGGRDITSRNLNE